MKNDVSDSEPFELENWLPFRFSIVANNVGNALERTYGQEFGMKNTGWRAMAALGRFAPMSAKELGEHIAVDQVTASRAISELAGLGFLSRRTDKIDRRRIVLSLSKKGKSAYDEIVPEALRAESFLLAGLTEEEQTQLKSISEKLVERSRSL